MIMLPFKFYQIYKERTSKIKLVQIHDLTTLNFSVLSEHPLLPDVVLSTSFLVRWELSSYACTANQDQIPRHWLLSQHMIGEVVNQVHQQNRDHILCHCTFFRNSEIFFIQIWIWFIKRKYGGPRIFNNKLRLQ